MIEGLLAWGVTSVATSAFVEVLKKLLEGATEDYVKDFFKDTFKSGVERIQGDDLKKAVGKAYQEFLDCVHDQFVGKGMEEEDARKYSQSLEKLLRNPEVKNWLSSAFQPERKLDDRVLANTYEQLHLLPLPEEFSWKWIARLYGKRVDKIISESPKLREIFTASNIQATAEATKELAGIVPGFDLTQYCKNLNDRYGYLKLANIDATDQNYRVRLWQIFVPQDVREELPPHRYELPLDVLLRLQTGTSGDLDPDQVERYKERYFQAVPKPTLEVVQKCSYVVILGNPGAGKSTLLQYLALNWAEKPTEQIPLMVELREYVRDETQPRDFLKFWHQGCRNICDLNQFEVDHELKAGATRVLLDGLDEVIESDVKDRVIGEIIKFKNEYPHTQIIVTSRIIGYDSNY